MKIPQGMHSVTPHLVCAGAAKAIDFYKQAFGAQETARMPGPDGKLMHAAVRIGDSTVMLADEMPEWGSLGPKSLKGSPVTIHLYVDDVDSFVARAVKAGAKVTMPVADQFWGDRYGKLEDPFGHHWSVRDARARRQRRRGAERDAPDGKVDAERKLTMPKANPSPGFKKYPEHRVETRPASAHVRVTYQGEVIADTRDALEMHESMGEGKRPRRRSSTTSRART